MLASRREMEYIFATEAERDAMYDQFLTAVAPAMIIESTAPWPEQVPDPPLGANADTRRYTRDEVYLTKEDFDRAMNDALARQQAPTAARPKPPRKPRTDSNPS